MTTIFVDLPLQHLQFAHTLRASNDAVFHCATGLTQPTCAGNVRLLRRAQDQDHARFVMSGKLADVCAALDALAKQEVRQSWRCAGA